MPVKPLESDEPPIEPISAPPSEPAPPSILPIESEETDDVEELII